MTKIMYLESWTFDFTSQPSVLRMMCQQVTNYHIALHVTRKRCFFISLTTLSPPSYTPLAPKPQNEESQTTKPECSLP